MPTTIWTDAYKAADFDILTDGGSIHYAIRKSDGAPVCKRENARGAMGSEVVMSVFGTGNKNVRIHQESPIGGAAMRAVCIGSNGATKIARSINGGADWTLL